MRLNNKVALITGVAGPKGMGYASAKRLAEEGASLAIADISNEVYNRFDDLKKMGYEVVAFRLDLRKFKDVNKMVGKVVNEYGKIDILANIAGVAPRGKDQTAEVIHRFVDITEKEWDDQIAINLKTTYNCTRSVLPFMIKQRYGKIINMSSVTGTVVSGPGASAYSAAKGGVSGMTKAIALEVAEYGITINAIAPGWIDTGRELERKAGLSSPMQRAGKPEEVANLVLFLATDESSYINGHDIIIDGGNILQEYKGLGDVV